MTDYRMHIYIPIIWMECVRFTFFHARACVGWVLVDFVGFPLLISGTYFQVLWLCGWPHRGTKKFLHSTEGYLLACRSTHFRYSRKLVKRINMNSWTKGFAFLTCFEMGSMVERGLGYSFRVHLLLKMRNHQMTVYSSFTDKNEIHFNL